MQDHRKLGRDLELFHSDPLVGAGLPLWLPAGAAARRAVEDYLHALERRNGYQHVYSPPLAKQEMYVRSGHLPHFADDMFPPMALSEHDAFVLRPSLCPHHAAVFNARGRSYRELPLRIGEIGGQYRAERSGVLGGLSRVRAISLNDGHVFCTEEQVHAEVVESLRLMRVAHDALGFEPSSFRLSLRGEGGNTSTTPPCGRRRRRCCGPPSTTPGCPMWRPPARRRSTGRRSTCSCSTTRAGRAPSRPCRSTTSSRRGSTCPMWTPTAPGAARSWCTAAWPAAWSGSSRT